MTTYLEPKLPEAGLAGSYINGAWHWPEGRLTVENPSRRSADLRGRARRG